MQLNYYNTDFGIQLYLDYF